MSNATFVEVFPLVEPSYLKVYDWEQIELTRVRRWVGRNWKFSVYASVIYVVLIYLGRNWMQKRPAFHLRYLLTTWNILLATFSIIGFLRTAPELFFVLKEPNGFYSSVCTRWQHNYATACWGFLMTMSKLIELGDTAFIVLRKQPLIFLHWFHHCSVLIYCWVTYEDYEPSLRWFMTMNMFVHALMYSYYALKSLKVKVPRYCSMIITCLQLSQMVVGVFINLYSLKVKGEGKFCDRGYDVIQLALSMYASYFVLFSMFFHRAYFKSRVNKYLNIDNDKTITSTITAMNNNTPSVTKKQD